MDTTRFAEAQVDLAAAAHAVFQRWTVDEIADDVVRVLVGEVIDPDHLHATTKVVLDWLASPVADRTELGRQLQDQAMEVELASASATWSEELAVYLPLANLRAFLQGRRGGKPGLPKTRPLREGDTFWVLLPARPTPGLPEDAEDELAAGALWLLAAEQVNADVWDVTAAARQASKHAYQAVVRTTGPEPAGGETVAGGG